MRMGRGFVRMGRGFGMMKPIHAPLVCRLLGLQARGKDVAAGGLAVDGVARESLVRGALEAVAGALVGHARFHEDDRHCATGGADAHGA